MRNPNGVIWRPTLDNHVESYFMKLNLVDRGLALWVKFTFYVPKRAPKDAKCEVWAIFFDVGRPDRIVGLKNSFPAADAKVDFDAPRIEVGGSIFEPPHTKGEVSGDGHSISWDFSWESLAEPLIHFPHELMYKAKIPKSKAVSPYPHARASGSFTIDGERVEFSGVPAMQGHNWGSEHAFRYAWAHSNCFEGRDSVYFEGFSAQVKMGPVLSPVLSSAFLWRDGELLRFDTPQSFVSKPVEIYYNMWRFTIKGRGYVLEGEISAPKELFAGLRYYNPDGSLAYCLNSKVATAHLILREQKSGRLIEELFSKNACALEVLTRDEGHGVRVFV